MQTLRQSSAGPAVGALQQALLEAGHDIRAAELVAPVFGPSTEAAVREYQASHGLVVDGIVGPNTQAALGGLSITASPDGVPGVALWVPADPDSYGDHGPGRVVTEVVMHITSGRGAALATAQMFATPWRKRGAPGPTSAHFVVGQDGSVIQCVRLAASAMHAHAANGYSIGIEHCAREPGEFHPDDPGLPLSEAQIVASVTLVRWLCSAFGLPCTRAYVMGHAEADKATTHTGCPEAVAFGWPWEKWCT